MGRKHLKTTCFKRTSHVFKENVRSIIEAGRIKAGKFHCDSGKWPLLNLEKQNQKHKSLWIHPNQTPDERLISSAGLYYRPCPKSRRCWAVCAPMAARSRTLVRSHYFNGSHATMALERLLSSRTRRWIAASSRFAKNSAN